MATFLVTGASGYIASWIVKYLLEQGEQVHGTVRSLNDSGKIGHLLDLQQQFPGKLVLFEADLLRKESFREAMKGCSIILHTASPFYITKIKNPVKELVEPAVEGTRNVLTLASQFPEIRRIVVTSSVAAVYGDAADIRQTSGQIFTEEHWNITSNAGHNPYQYSKTLAEREAWQIAGNQSQWTLATINPGFVLGPSLSKRVDSTSIDTMRALLNGKYKTGVPELYFGVADVRDVAMAHLLAAGKSAISGRHIVVADVIPILGMAKILRKSYPDKPIPSSTLPGFLLYLVGPMMGFSWKFLRLNLGIPYRFNNEKSRHTLGLQYHTLEQTLVDHASQIVKDHLV
jgi:nucleoside-diphosphate-sugar epimerase